MMKTWIEKGLISIALGILMFVLAMGFGGVGIVAAVDLSPTAPTLEWSIAADFISPESSGTEGVLPPAKTGSLDTLQERLTAAGAVAAVQAVGSEDKGTVYALQASGKGDVESFRRLLHVVVKPQFNILGGVTAMEIDTKSFAGREVELVLEANPSTGYGWRLEAGSAVSEHKSTRYEKHTLGYGVPQRQFIHLTLNGEGKGPIRLIYKRLWEDAVPTRYLKLSLASLPAKLDLSNPTAPTTPLALPQGIVHDQVFPSVSKKELPSHFDWRDSGIVPAIRDQGSCGSCWAFGTVGVFESTLWKNNVANKDLSEQFLVSCNEDGWNCEEGGFTAHKYHYDTKGKNQSSIGGVLEADKPYTDSDGDCTGNYNKPYKLTGWQFITGSEWEVATVEQIKNAIYTYGPVTAGVCAGNAWDSYSSGVFTTDETSQCDGSTNHQIILVGWDDPGEYWILRNSWGEKWGINGYMHIGWTVSRVGEGTSWVTTPGVAAPISMGSNGDQIAALFADYGNDSGIWSRDLNSWRRLTDWQPARMIGYATTGLLASFNDYGSGNGLWRYDGSWARLTDWVPADMVEYGSSVAGKFSDYGSGNGLWSYTASSWSRLTDWQPDSMVAMGSTLVGKFSQYGSGNGIWSYSASSWNHLTDWIPERLSSWGSSRLAAIFTNYSTDGNGVWIYENSSWQRVTDWTPTKVVSWSNNGKLAGIFSGYGSGNGLYSYNGSSWTRLTDWVPADITTSGGTGELTAVFKDYGSGNGLWRYNEATSSWTRISDWIPDAVSTGVSYLTAVFTSYGSGGNGVWKYDSAPGAGWTRLTDWLPKEPAP